MKKIISITLSFLLLFSVLSFAALADSENSVSVYVTISDKNGNLALIQEPVTVTDIDNDNSLTINDALYCAHEAKYPGGAAAGYVSSYGDFGLSLDKLWGTANGQSYGYYVNNTSAWSLADTVKENDYINAFVYTDLATFSDTYSYFDINTVTRKPNGKISLTLSAAGYDAEWNPVVIAVEGATITVDGVATAYKTDAEGKVTIAINNDGKHVISAVSDARILVPPVCVARIDCEHSVTVIKNKKTATYFEKGYTGDKICKDCGATVSKGKTVALLTLNAPKVSVSAGKAYLKVTYKKATGAKGYQVKYIIGKKTVVKTYKSSKAAVKKYTKLKKGTYKVYVRSFVIKKGYTTVYSNWSKVKTAKVK